MKPTVKRPECYNSDLYKFGKDKTQIKIIFVTNVVGNSHYNQLKSIYLSILNVLYVVKGTYLHHKYTYHASFKCNDKKFNQTFKRIIPMVIDDPSSITIGII